MCSIRACRACCGAWLRVGCAPVRGPSRSSTDCLCGLCVPSTQKYCVWPLFEQKIKKKDMPHRIHSRLSPSVAIMLASAAAIELRPTPELFLTPEPKPSDASKICAWGRVHPVLTVTRTNRSIYIARLCIFAKFCLFQLDSTVLTQNSSLHIPHSVS